MRLIRILLIVVQALLLAGLAFVLSDPRVPLGVPGEWVWDRLQFGSTFSVVLLTLVGLLVYVGFAALGWRALARRGGPVREFAWVACLVVAAVAVQVVIAWAAPAGLGLAKWALALQKASASGYYTVARTEIQDPWEFLANYPDWIQRQKVPRRGAHPPGLFLVTHGVLSAMEAHPRLAERVLRSLPDTVLIAFSEIDRLEPLSATERAALGLIGALTLLGCAATVAPLYVLARSSLPAHWAWAAAVLWPLVPSALMFQPAADTAFPFVSTTALALACWATRSRPSWALGLACASGALLAIGLLFTLAFLPFGLTVALVFLSASGLTWQRRGALIAATGAGFFCVVFGTWAIAGVNPFVIWWWNRIYHARFYALFPKSYAPWVVVNLLELAAGVGIPTVVWTIAGLSLRRTPRVVWAALAVVMFLNFGGLTLSEVGRLWLPWMPPMLVASASGLQRLEAGAWTFSATTILLGLQTLLLQASVQVVYPAT
jgi:methylthioxylose transferase